MVACQRWSTRLQSRCRQKMSLASLKCAISAAAACSSCQSSVRPQSCSRCWTRATSYRHSRTGRGIPQASAQYCCWILVFRPKAHKICDLYIKSSLWLQKRSVTYQHVLDVSIAIIEVGNDFFEILQKQVFVVQKLLAFNETRVGILGDIFTLL